jgi:hypothetical protein
MRTTLDIDDDVLQAAKGIAKSQRKTAGKVLSELARKALTTGLQEARPVEYRGGFELLPRTGTIVTLERIQVLLDDE